MDQQIWIKKEIKEEDYCCSYASSSTSSSKSATTSSVTSISRKSSPIGGSISETHVEIKVERCTETREVKPSTRILPKKEKILAAPGVSSKSRPTTTGSAMPSSSAGSAPTFQGPPRTRPSAVLHRRHTVTGTIQIPPQPLPQHILERRSSDGPRQPRRKRKLGDSEPLGFKYRSNNRHAHQSRRQNDLHKYQYGTPSEYYADSDDEYGCY